MKNNTRIRWIDALRGYGAISVVIVHLIQAMQERKLLGGNFAIMYLLNGARAVQMFFMITGLTTFMILDSDKYSGGSKDIIKNDGFLFFHHT